MVFGEYGSSRYIGPYVLSSQLNSAGIKTLVIDYFTEVENFFEYISHFISEETSVIGISSTFLFPKASTFANLENRSQGVDLYYTGELWFKEGDELLKWTKQLKQVIHKKSPHCKLILGGVKSQFAHWRPNYYKHFDHIFFGAADQSLLDFFKSIKEINNTERFLKQDSSLKNQGLCPVTIHNPDSAIQFKEALPVEISRGCLYDCKFCHYEKKSSQRKDLKMLKDELTRNYELFGTTVYHFCDDCFNDTRKKVEETCNAFLQLPFKLEWVAYARADVAVKFNETVDLMLESGARGLYWGIESFDHTAAKQAGKGTHPDLIKEFFLNYREKFKNNCLNEGSFIIGLPGETKHSLHSTLDWLIENDVFDFLTFGPLGIMPYSENFDNVVLDYADYSRNPAKYGFTKIEFGKKKYWEHSTMNSISAKEISSDFTRIWRSRKKSTSIFKTIWLYPHFRTLGYSHEAIFNFLNSDVNSVEIKDEIKLRFKNHRTTYHQHLKKSLL
jgi:radical SAM superfamily enzyme YgiQ (UPF0313 family)